MRVNISVKEGDYMEMEFNGEGHTLLNLIQSNLLKDKQVEMAGYTVPHPLMDKSRLFIKLNRGKDHLKVLKKALNSSKGELNEFLDGFEKSLTSYKQ
jgi:DNA-directed RNA polymerase subunit L